MSESDNHAIAFGEELQQEKWEASDPSLSGGSQGGRSQESQQHTLKNIGTRETRVVNSLRALLIIVLTLSAVGVAVGIYFYVSSVEDSKFEASFYASSFKVHESIGASLERTLKSLDHLAVTMVSFARSTNQTWPYVTLPDFAIRAAKVLSLSEATLLEVCPLVTNETRVEWEDYAVRNDNWVNESILLQENFDLFHGLNDYDWAQPDSIYGDFGDIPGNASGPFLPIWQAYPIATWAGYPPYNWDYLSQVSTAGARTALSKHTSVINEAALLPEPNDSLAVAEANLWIDWFSDFVPPGEPSDEPVSWLYVPIFDQVDQIRAPSSINESSAETYDPNDSNVVGLVIGALYWRSLLKNILPQYTNGVIVVFENPCNPPFTYQINGPNIEYLGRGDLHDTKYDGQKIASNLYDLDSFAVGKADYAGPPVDRDFCPFVINVYPSDLMRDGHTSSQPILFAMISILIFVFTTSILVVYDCTVERRQRLVMDKAMRSNAIVSSLFPKDVHDQLEKEMIETQKATATATKMGLQEFLKQNDGGDTRAQIRTTPPIASLYPEATVLFADIAGFTKWSSTRNPSDVFTLLETLYGAFDEIAKRQGVFKVETIGDCYVAVAGLPTPKKAHAVVMARFAHDIRHRMHEVIHELGALLGEDTAKLALRVGLNSGPVTAGVLRGEKSRFQLFGDCVNTAARMEASAGCNQIHLSESTAKLLLAAQKGAWLKKRSTQIEAKGKGMMQTYWLEIAPSSSSTPSSYDAGQAVTESKQEPNNGSDHSNDPAF